MNAVSVIIPCYNAGRFLRATIDSVLAQTVPVAEIIVVDDASTDDSAAIAESFGPPVRVIGQPNQGDCAARNHGVEEAAGDVVAFLDADDIWYPRKIEQQLAYLDRFPDAGAVTCSVDVLENGRTIRMYEASDQVLRTSGPLDYLAASLPPSLCTTLMVRRDVARSVRFPVGLARGGDIVYSALLRTKTIIGAVEEVLATYRRHPGQRTSVPEQWALRLESRTRWARQHYTHLGADSALQVELALLSRAVDETLHLYWTRELSDFKKRRRVLLDLWPEGAPIPPMLTRPVFPRFVLRMRDALDHLTRKPIMS